MLKNRLVVAATLGAIGLLSFSPLHAMNEDEPGKPVRPMPSIEEKRREQTEEKRKERDEHSRSFMDSKKPEELYKATISAIHVLMCVSATDEDRQKFAILRAQHATLNF